MKTTSDSTGGIIRRIRALPDVTVTATFPEVYQACSPRASCLSAIVASCTQLRVVAPKVASCSDTHPSWIRGASGAPRHDWQSIQPWLPGGRQDPSRSTLAPVTGHITGANVLAGQLNVEVVIPPTLPGVDALTAAGTVAILVQSGPGEDLVATLAAQGVNAQSNAYVTDYDLTVKLRTLDWAIAAVILSVGLLAFAIGAIDRAISRRREVVSLQVIGVGGRCSAPRSGWRPRCRSRWDVCWPSAVGCWPARPTCRSLTVPGQHRGTPLSARARIRHLWGHDPSDVGSSGRAERRAT